MVCRVAVKPRGHCRGWSLDSLFASVVFPHLNPYTVCFFSNDGPNEHSGLKPCPARQIFLCEARVIRLSPTRQKQCSHPFMHCSEFWRGRKEKKPSWYTEWSVCRVGVQLSGVAVAVCRSFVVVMIKVLLHPVFKSHPVSE